MLSKKKILLGVCGGIAAYKVAYVVRNLIKSGAEVKVIMTDAAKAFIGPVTLSTLSRNPVNSDFFDAETGSWANHVELALWADLFLIAPATSNTIAKMANGICDNLLLATYFSAKNPVIIAPAMDLDMASHPSLARNMMQVEKDGVKIIPSEHGELASGLVGNGRMAEPEIIHSFIESFYSKDSDFEKKKILVNAGPTHEPIDPVRFIGNRSTGKMGVAIANELAERGAQVSLVLGPTNHTFSFHNNVEVMNVQTAEEMRDSCVSVFPSCSAAILSAAVADFTPVSKSDIKIKKSSNTLTLDLVKTPDTLAELGKIKRPDQILIGFALETNNELENAKSKLERKRLDMIVLNSLKDSGAGFGYDTNKITTIDKTGEICTFGLKSKNQVATDIVDKLKTLIN
jgi:phosphopantothenoylcysteine decarboxylase / phosphopantothenate---cysteine ligase